jgi:predicted DNA-binding ribbon-helix-helix protein
MMLASSGSRVGPERLNRERQLRALVADVSDTIVDRPDFEPAVDGSQAPVVVARFDRKRDTAMKSTVIKRSIVIAGHKTSVSLEDAFWQGLKRIAAIRNMTLSDIVAAIDTGRGHGNLSSALRLFVLNHYQERTNSPPGPEQPPRDIMLVSSVGTDRNN